MKLKLTLLLAALAIAGSATYLIAQDGGAPDQRPPGGPGGEGRHRPPPPLFAALDTNHDGVIDSTEIDNAPASLRKLDKNGDGKLTMDEVRPPRPEGRGPDGEGRPPGGPQPGN